MRPTTACLLLWLVGIATGGACRLEAAEPASPAGSSRYLDMVRRTADALLEHGRDSYGQQHSAMILSVLDAKTARPLAALPRAPAGVRQGDRTGPGGSNANLQQDLYRALQHLSRLTGDERYARAVRDALVDFLRITQHPDTGLLAWGEHLSWDCVNDALYDPYGTTIHEPKRKFIFFDLCYAAEPERTLGYARGLWEHQIFDQQTGDFSRHARYDRHRPGKGYDFAKEGSYFIDTWSRAYEKTGAKRYERAVAVLANRYAERTSELGLLDQDTSGDQERVNLCVTLWLVSLAMECHDAAARMDGPTVELLHELAARYDKGFLGLDHAPDDRQRGFVCYAYTDSGRPRPHERKQSAGYSQHWAMGYGINTTSMFGLLSYTRQTQLGGSNAGGAYRRLVVRAADLYRSVAPDAAADDIWAGEYGMAIMLELAALRLTGEPAYLEAARRLADQAIDALWKEGDVLPRASTRTGYYDVISYPDTLLLALLALHEHLLGLEPRVEISDLNR